MTTYQTKIQNPGAIRWGSAMIEIQDDDQQWINLGAVKNISATTTSSGMQRYEPDNAPPIIIDPTPETWDWKWDMQEAWNVSVLKLLRGDIDTYTESGNATTIGVYAGSGTRPSRSIRITNTTPGSDKVVITLTAAKLTSELDWSFPTDKDGTTAIQLSVTVSAYLAGADGFGTIEVPN